MTGTLSTIISCVNLGIVALPQINDIISRQSTDKVVKEIVDRGYSYYSSSSVVDISKGLSEEGLKRCLELGKGEYDIPEKYKKKYEAFTEKAFLSTKGALCYVEDILFTNADETEKRGIFLRFMTSLEDGKYNLLVCCITLECELAPDLFIHEVCEKGFFQNETQTLRNEEVAKSMTDDDLKQLLTFLRVVALQEISRELQIDLPAAITR